jgi:hypothetical protein
MSKGFETLWDGFDKVCDKAERGEEFTKIVIKYMECRHKIEQKYAGSLSKMNTIFSEREDGYDPFLHNSLLRHVNNLLISRTTKDCWNAFGAETAALAQDRQAFVTDVENVIAALKEQLITDKKTRTDV